MNQELMTLDFWQDTVIYEGKTFPVGTLACDALNVPADTITRMNEQCEKINLLLGMLNAGQDTSALFPMAKEAALTMLEILSKTPPFSYMDIPKHRERIEKVFTADNAWFESAEQLDSHMSRLEHRGNMVMGKTRIEALDNSLFDKLQVFDGDISPMLEPDNNAIAIAVSLDDYGNLPNLEYYPKVGDTITATYADDVKYIDSRTGELCTEDTPEEYLQEKLYGARDVAYTVCALVELPYSMSYRYGGIGYETVLSVDTAQRDSGGAAIPLLYLFDTADEADEAEAEQYLSKLTAGEFSPLMYESKATARSEFAQFRQMFLLIGGILCAIIGLVGLLNFFNAMMTSILSRRREFAVLQAVGMTNRQLKTMLIYEGLFYAMSSVSAAFILSLAVGPLAGKMLGSMFWFFEYRFTILPVLLTIPVFLLLGWLIPCMMYDNAAKCSVVEQLRDAQ